MKIKIILGVLIICAISVAGWYYMNFKKYAPSVYVTDSPSGDVTRDTTTNTESTTTPKYTISDVITHKDITSCYTIISGSVYDVTMWVNLHPGGKMAILSICGVDGTEKFLKKHKGGEKFMTILSRYKIGTLAQ